MVAWASGASVAISCGEGLKFVCQSHETSGEIAHSFLVLRGEDYLVKSRPIRKLSLKLCRRRREDNQASRYPRFLALVALVVHVKNE